ncbi:uncharacterized protein LOC135430442 [Drosophila montana]|uniref:uncharacterized protein LOC135430442 n=1 Tax=Drosophila montana TaxID=40370 RepID=UPI00313CF8B7
MIKETLLWETLHTVEQLEVAFEETLQTIDDLNNRYRLIATRKKSAEKRQRLYESEIQAAITEPTYTNILTCPMRRKKRSKKRTVYRTQTITQKSNKQAEQPILSLQANCTYELNLNGSSSGIHSVEARIHQDQTEPATDARPASNGSGMSDASEQTDPTLCSCSTHCCPYCRCKTYYF